LTSCAPQSGEEVLLDAVVENYLVDASPQQFVFERRVDGFKQALLSEGSAGTSFYSSDGCWLGGGGPVMSGASVRIAGHVDDGALIADTVWLLDIVMERGDCNGPPAE
jgi:hypothetical protein